MQQLQLCIPEPCHQNWDDMTPTEQGRFCNACAKQVIDFSAMSDTQVLTYFSNLKHDNVCGRAYPDQLDRMITLPKPVKKRLFWQWHYITMLFLFFSKSNAKAQGGLLVVSKTDLNKQKVINVNEALAGKAAGSRSSAEVKLGQSTSIRLGSVSSIKSNTPALYVVDNVVISDRDASKLNPDDVENYEILQAAKATAIYGVQASGGAILITTKKKVHTSNNKTINKESNSVLLTVTDNATMQQVEKASITIATIGNEQSTVILTNEKGMGKIENIQDGKTYIIKISAAGYLNQELQIAANDFDKKEINREIFLEKAATKEDYKKMDSVIINSGTYCTKRMGGMTGSMTVVRKRTYVDTVKLLTTTFTGALKIAPNPVRKGSMFSIELKVKQTGIYHLQLIDAGGQVVLQKQININAKQYTEQIAAELKWSSGTYFMRVLNAGNTLVSTGKLIIQ